MRALVLAALIAAPALALASDTYDEYPLEGYALHGGQALVEPDPTAPEGSHMHLVMKGAAARVFFDRMGVAAEEDACTGGLVKRAETGVTCLAFPEGDAECFFAIDLRDGTIGPAGIVC